MTANSVVAVFATQEEAQAGIAGLERGGFPRRRISLIAYHLDSQERLAVSHGDQTERQAATGAATGGVLGLLAGSTLLAIPGIGPVVFAGAIASGLTGTIVGALVGAMGGWGIPEHHVQHYEDLLTQGKWLVLAHGAPEELAEVQTLLEAAHPEELQLHAVNAEDDPRIAGR